MFHIWPFNLEPDFDVGMEHLEKTLCDGLQINNDNCIHVVLEEKIGRFFPASFSSPLFFLLI